MFPRRARVESASSVVDIRTGGELALRMRNGGLEAALDALEREPPEAGLPVVRALRARLDELEAAFVERAIRAGWTWREVAKALGVTKQAAHKKHAARTGPVGRPRAAAETPFVVTGGARRAVRLAREEARAAGHTELAPGHLLLGVLRGDGPAAKALARAGASLEAGRELLGRGRPLATGRPIPISGEVRAAFEESLREAVRRGDAFLGAEHLLLVLAREGDGPGLPFLRELGIDAAAIGPLLDDARERGGEED